MIALVPAKSRSTGIPGKNFRRLGGRTLVAHAVQVGRDAGCEVVVSSDVVVEQQIQWGCGATRTRYLHRPSELARDDTPMIDVVKHAMGEIPGAPDDIFCLLQPTQPFRTPAHVRQAIALLRETQADSVVSVVELPKTHNPMWQFIMRHDGQLSPWIERSWEKIGACRQSLDPTYIRDGTVYAFWRRTVEQHGTIYGQDVRPLIIAPEDSCELDTEENWREVERRWRERT